MRCLYCGKEIGAFRLLRDSEFCGSAHRKNYGERLGKALHKIAAPEPPPAPLATFAQNMPIQIGVNTFVLEPWQTATNNSVSLPTGWPLTVDGCLGGSYRPFGPQPSIGQGLARVDARLQTGTTTVCLPALETEPLLEPAPAAQPVEEVPPLYSRWAKSPAPEAVATFVRTSRALNPAAAATRFPAALELPPVRRTLMMAGALPALAAEPVAEFLRLSAATSPVELQATPARVPQFTLLLAVPEQHPAICGTVPAPAAEPAETFVHYSAAMDPAKSASRAGQHALELAVPAQAFAVSGAGFLPAPYAEPAEIFVFSASAVLPLEAPANAHHRALEFAISAQPYAFSGAGFLPAPAAEPVEIFVRSAAALAPLELPANARLHTPEFAISAQPDTVTAAPEPAIPAQPYALSGAGFLPAPGAPNQSKSLFAPPPPWLPPRPLHPLRGWLPNLRFPRRFANGPPPVPSRLPRPNPSPAS